MLALFFIFSLLWICQITIELEGAGSDKLHCSFVYIPPSEHSEFNSHHNERTFPPVSYTLQCRRLQLIMSIVAHCSTFLLAKRIRVVGADVSSSTTKVVSRAMANTTPTDSKINPIPTKATHTAVSNRPMAVNQRLNSREPAIMIKMSSKELEAMVSIGQCEWNYLTDAAKKCRT